MRVVVASIPSIRTDARYRLTQAFQACKIVLSPGKRRIWIPHGHSIRNGDHSTGTFLQRGQR